VGNGSTNGGEGEILVRLVADDGFDAARWSDRSGAGNDATQSESSRRPTLVSDAVGSRAAVRFDGEDDVMRVPVDINPDIRPNLTFFIVFSSEVGDGERRKLFGNDNGGFDRTVGLDSRADTNFTYFSGSGVEPITDIEADTYYLATLEFQLDQFSAWMDGGRVVDAAPVDHGTGQDFFEIGSDGDDSYYWQGDIAELRVYNGALSDSRRSEIEEELASSYGL
jgi:hypothetical protein